MRKYSIKQRAFAVALAAAFAFTPGFTGINAYAAEAVEEATEESFAAGVADMGIQPVLAIKETTGENQIVTGYTFTYGYGGNATIGVPQPKKEKDPDTKITTEYDYTLHYLVYNKGDRTKPVIGSVSTDTFGKKVPSGRTISYVDPQKNPEHKNEINISTSYMEPGKKEIVAYTFDKYNYEKDSKALYEAAMETYNAQMIEFKKNGSVGVAPESPDMSKMVSKADYMVPSAPVEFDVEMEASVSPAIKATSITLSMYSSCTVDGYEIYRKVGKKYVKIATVSASVYADKGLTANTMYTYKVRPYYVNPYTGATSYGKYTITDIVTTGSALKLKAAVTKKNKVKLSWTKVKNATKYQIYRYESASSSVKTTVSKGMNDSFGQMKLIATVKKNKKTYTDKKVSANRAYNYVVRAVLPKNNKQSVYVDDSKYVDIGFGDIDVTQNYTDNKGNRTLNWIKVYGADGYIVDKMTTTYQPSVYTYNGYDLCFDGSFIYYVNDDGKVRYLYKVEAGLLYAVDEATKTVDGETEYVPHVQVKPVEGKKVSGNLVYYYHKNSNNVEVVDSYIYYLDAGQKKVYEVDDYDGTVYYKGVSDWVEYKKLPATTTSVVLPAETRTTPNNEVYTDTTYRIRAYKGNKYSSGISYKTNASAGMVEKVTAKSVANGISVSWTPVNGAAYYKVYRVPTALLVDDKDIGGFATRGNEVTEYVGAKAPVAVDANAIAAWNARYETDKQKRTDDGKALDKAYNKAKKAADKAYSQAVKAAGSDKAYYNAQQEQNKTQSQLNYKKNLADKKASENYNTAYAAALKNYNAAYAEGLKNYNAAYSAVYKKYKADVEAADEKYTSLYEDYLNKTRVAEDVNYVNYQKALKEADEKFDKAYDEAAEKYNKAYNEANDKYLEARNKKQQEYYDAYTEAAKKFNEAADKAREAYDKAYDEAKEAYDKADKAAKEAYDKDYKEKGEAYEKAYKEANDAYQKDYDKVNEAYQKALKDYEDGKTDTAPNPADYQYPKRSSYNYPKATDYVPYTDSTNKNVDYGYPDSRSFYPYGLSFEQCKENFGYPKASEYYPDQADYAVYMQDYNFPYRGDYYPDWNDYKPDPDDYELDEAVYGEAPDPSDYSIYKSYYTWPEEEDYLPNRDLYFPSTADYTVYSSDYQLKDLDKKDYYPLETAYYPSRDDYKIDEYSYINNKLEPNVGYHYQNYSYSRNIFPAGTTSIVDYCGDLYDGNGWTTSDIRYAYTSSGSSDVAKSAEMRYRYNPIVRDDYVRKSALKAGVSYTYYVVAYFATAKTKADYDNLSTLSADFVVARNTTAAACNQVEAPASAAEYAVGVVNYDSSDFKDYTGATVGCKKVGTATYTVNKAAGKPVIKSVKATKGKVTVKIKKKVKAASYYKIYRSNKKKGTYVSVGVTKNNKTLTFTDKSAVKGKTYYYKVVSVVKNEALGEIESKASKPKKVKAK